VVSSSDTPLHEVEVYCVPKSESVFVSRMSSVWKCTVSVFWPNSKGPGSTFKLKDVRLVVLPWRSSCFCVHCDEVVGWPHLSLMHSSSVHVRLPVMCNSVSDILLECPTYTVRHERFCLLCTIINRLGDTLIF
jgi:hypothetical protein